MDIKGEFIFFRIVLDIGSLGKRIFMFFFGVYFVLLGLKFVYCFGKFLFAVKMKVYYYK